MEIIKIPKAMQKIADSIHRAGKTIGFVPTMGYLHQGHLDLVKIARKRSDIVVTSIFVNPTQFGPKEDLNKYPRDFNRDKKLLVKEKVDYIFYPTVKSMYQKDYTTFIDLPFLANVLCGKSRPAHFQGVATIVAKLFNIVKPDLAVFGQKDGQQAVIIKQMVQDLNFPIKIIIAPTTREKDGLAMSSRNIYLTPEQREQQATVLYHALQHAKKMIKDGEKNIHKIIALMEELIQSMPDAEIDYIQIVNANTLQPIKQISGTILIALAVKFGHCRLIDNTIVKV
jgi:pantoate--beta-alanine ligase